MTNKNSDWNETELDLQPMMSDGSSLMMSDALRGQVPVLEGEIDEEDAERQVKKIAAGLIQVLAHRKVDGKESPIFGILREVLFDEPCEMMFKTDIESALSTVEAPGCTFDSFELHYGERVVNVSGPFFVKAQRIMDIEPESQACVLALCLTRSLKDIIA